MTHINTQPDALAEFAFVYTQTVAWGDMDALGHVNNVVYHRYAESARIGYLAKLDMFSKNFLLLAQTSCTYLKPVIFPDTLHLGVRCQKIGNTSMIFEYVFFSEQQNTVVAKSQAVMVQMDNVGENKEPWSEEQRQKVLAFESK